MATSGHKGGANYMRAQEGELYRILQVGLPDKAGWLYVESTEEERGWISQKCFTRCRMRDPRICFVGKRQEATSSQQGGNGLINATKGERYQIQYIGLYREEEGWLYVKSRDGEKGWIPQDRLEIVS